MARTPTKAKPVEFSTTSRLKKSGGSLVLTVPATARDMLGLTEGQEMIISVSGSQVVVEAAPNQASVVKVRKPKYSLDELIAGYDADAPRSAEERAWIDAPAAGNETW